MCTILAQSTTRKVGSTDTPGNEIDVKAGDLVVIHRKVHLFDIDIPGKIKFKVKTLVK